MENTALLVIDVQNEYFTGKLPIAYPDNSINNIVKVIDFANSKNIPVIAIRHAAIAPDSPTFAKNSYEWELHDSIKDKNFHAIVDKNYPGSFKNTNLENILKELNVKKLIISGYMTQMCCDTTSRQAFHRGYENYFISDATGTINVSNYAGEISAKDLHEAILITQAMRFAKVISTLDLINGNL